MDEQRLYDILGQDVEVPDVVNKKLDHTYSQLEEKEHPAKRKGPHPLRMMLIAAALAALLCGTAAASGGGQGPLSWILSAFSRAGGSHAGVVQAQIDEGQWIGLNGDNIAVIVPTSPVTIMLSGDGGNTWRESVVLGSEEMELFGDLRDDVQYWGGFIGFFGEDGGYLVLTADVAMNNQPMRIYLTSDGGGTWSEIGNPYDWHISVLTGAAFSTPEIGFVSYRYYMDFGPDIWWTSDGGATWAKLPVTLPEGYDDGLHRFTPGSPMFDGARGVYPIFVADRNSDTAETIYMYSDDYGLTWAFPRQ